MPSTTARDTASVFQKKPATPNSSPRPWSGRVDVTDMSRPGGLLTAALMQSAAERGLSLSDLASALGVSYWSLSQLRIGFRPIEALDEEVMAACSAWLDVPPLTVQMLAGLLTPQDALACPELTAEDLLHARQMARTAPADWVLLPPPNRTRPLQGLTVDELADLHREHADTPTVVELLRGELACRPYSKTEQLRAALARETATTPPPDAATAADAPPASGILCCTRCQKRLRIPHLPQPSEIRCPSCRSEYAVHWQGLVCLVQALTAPAPADDSATDTDDDPTSATDEPATAPQDAWAVLGLAANSPWEQVERARRSLLQQYHPDRLGHVSPLVRQLAEAAFKRVSDAYETLKAQR